MTRREDLLHLVAATGQPCEEVDVSALQQQVQLAAGVRMHETQIIEFIPVDVDPRREQELVRDERCANEDGRRAKDAGYSAGTGGSPMFDRWHPQIVEQSEGRFCDRSGTVVRMAVRASRHARAYGTEERA
jgi:hypothetical protein